MNIEIIAVGVLKKHPLLDLWNDYIKRSSWNITIYEIESKQKNPDKYAKEIESKIISKISTDAYKIALDERGKSYKSVDFAKKIENLQNTGHTKLQFIIGAANGLTQEIRNKSDLLLSFGMQTWPHMLVRIMLIEQIYRTQQIISGHPYHRE